MSNYTIVINNISFGIGDTKPYHIYRKGWNSFLYIDEVEKYFNLAGYDPVTYMEVEELEKYGNLYLEAIKKFKKLLAFA